MYNDYKSSPLWKEAHEAVLSVYKLAQDFPKSEEIGLTYMIKKEATAIPVTIAKSFNKNNCIDKARAISNALCSLDGLHYCLQLANDLGYSDTTSATDQLNNLGEALKNYQVSVIESLN